MITEKPNGKYLVDARDEYGKRIERTFRTKTEAKAYEAGLTTKKYKRQLENNGLKEHQYLMQSALEDFERTKIDLRPKSIQKYKMVTREFLKFIEKLEIKYIDEFTPEYATFYFNEVTKERIDPRKKKETPVRAKPKTVNFYLTTIKAFFQLQYVKGLIKRNPMLHIRNLRVEKNKPEYYTIEELKSFFSQQMPNSYKSAFMGFLFSGLRFAELANLTWDDIDFSKKLIIVRSKENFKTKTHNANRIIPMNKILFQIIMDRCENYSAFKYVFSSSNGFQLRERKTLQICKKVASDAGIKSNAYIHKFRHTYATMLILRGTSIQNIKELLGHWSVIETERYAHNKSDHLFSDVQRLDNLLTA